MQTVSVDKLDRCVNTVFVYLTSVLYNTVHKYRGRADVFSTYRGHIGLNFKQYTYGNGNFEFLKRRQIAYLYKNNNTKNTNIIVSIMIYSLFGLNTVIFKIYTIYYLNLFRYKWYLNTIYKIQLYLYK